MRIRNTLIYLAVGLIISLLGSMVETRLTRFITKAIITSLDA